MAGYSNLPPKKDVARALLLRGNVFVYLDPRAKAAQVPDWMQNQPQLVLQIGLDMPTPIPDLRVDDKGVSGTLSFNRAPYRCHVGWDAVFALVGDDGRGMVWPSDFPPEIAAEVEREAGKKERRRLAVEAEPDSVEREAAVGDEPRRRRRKPLLRVIDGGSTVASTPRLRPLTRAAAPSTRAHLRVVK